MRVLQIHNHYREAGGEDMVVEAEAELLRKAGHQVRQVLTRNPHQSSRAGASLMMAMWNPLWVNRIDRAIERFEPDIAHIHNTWFSFSPAVIRTLANAGVPTVMTLHNYRITCINALLYRDGSICEDCVGRNPWPGVQHACYRDSFVASALAAVTLQLHRSLRTFSDVVDVIIVLTEFQRDLIIRSGLPPGKLVIKPNFVPDPGLRSQPPSVSNIVLYVGRLSEEKGLRVLVDAWARAQTDNLELWIVGDGPERGRLQDNLPPRTKMLGAIPRDGVYELMFNARAAVMPSQSYEGFPVAAVESMATGLPVLTSGLGPLAEIGGRLGTDWVVQGATTQDWESALSRLGDGKAVDEAGHLARRVFEESYSPERNQQMLAAIYRSARESRGAV